MKRIAVILILSAGMGWAEQTGQERLAQLIERDLSALNLKLAELLTKYNQGHPEVRALEAQINQLRAEQRSLAKSPTAGGFSGDRWWRNPAAAQSLGLSADQQKRMDDIFQQHRVKLIDLNATLEKEEAMLEPLMDAQPLAEAKVTAQIDRVAQARAELEKANGRMLLGIRKVLTAEQWMKVNGSSSQASLEGSPIIKTGQSFVVHIAPLTPSEVNITVSSEGTVTLPLIGNARAAGMSLMEFQRNVQRAYADYMRLPEITVRLADIPAGKNPVIRSGENLFLHVGVVNPSDFMVAVKTDGMATVPLIGGIRAEGLSLTQFQQAAQHAYAGYIKIPQVTVTPADIK